MRSTSSNRSGPACSDDDLAEERARGGGPRARAGRAPRRSRSRPVRRGPRSTACVARARSCGPTLRTAPVRNLSRVATFRGHHLPYACMVMAMTPARSTVPRDRAAAPADAATPVARDHDQLDQLALPAPGRCAWRRPRGPGTSCSRRSSTGPATRSTRDVSSLYLLDRDGAYLTLAATNGLDRFQIGRARVPFGEGVTGRVAASREPLVIPDVKADTRFLWVRGIDQRRFVASMLSVPLTWHDQIVGVLNVQTEQPRDFTPGRRRPARRDRRPARRHRREGPPAGRGRGAGRGAQGHRRGAQRADRARHPRAADPARGRPRLRRPARRGAAARRPPVARHRAPRDTRAAWHRATLEQVERLDRLVDSILASVRVVPEGPAAVEPDRCRGRRRRGRSTRAAAAARQPPGRRPADRPAAGAGRPAAAPPDPRAPHRERGQVRPARDDHHDRLGPRRGRRPAGRERRGPGHPRGVARADLRAVRPPRHAHRARLRDRSVRRQAPRRIDGRPPVVRAGRGPTARASSSPCPPPWRSEPRSRGT